MEVGVIGTMVPPVESLLRVAKKNEERGYDAIWWPDHLMGLHHALWTSEITPLATAFNPHVYLDPVAAIAAAAVHTERIRLGVAVTECIRRHPAMVANEWLTLDHLSKGRAILGLGAGESENITPYGMQYTRPVSKLQEALAIIRLLWEHPGEPVDFDGEFWTLRDAVGGLGPYAPGRPPPIWLAANGPRMIDIAGRHADGWLPTIVPPHQYAERLQRLRAVAREEGRDPDHITPALSHYVILDEDHEECHRMLEQPIPRGMLLTLPSELFEQRGYEHPLGKDFYGLRDYIPTRYSFEQALAAVEAVPADFVHDLIFHGTPDDVADRVREYEAVGLRHFALLNITPMGSASKASGSFKLADAVVRALKRGP